MSNKKTNKHPVNLDLTDSQIAKRLLKIGRQNKTVEWYRLYIKEMPRFGIKEIKSEAHAYQLMRWLMKKNLKKKVRYFQKNQSDSNWKEYGEINYLAIKPGNFYLMFTTFIGEKKIHVWNM
jgi:hypothetical protein